LYLLVFLIGACTPTPSIATPPVVQTAVPTAQPILQPTPVPLPTSTATATIKPTSTLPQPSPTATTQPSAAATLPALNTTPVVPNCARFPNFGPCGANLNLSGRLAIYDTQRQVIQILDFQNKIDLELKPPSGMHTLQWTDQGNTLVSLNSENQPTLAWTNPVLSKLPLLPLRSPQGSAVFTGADGSTAWMEEKTGQYLIHVRNAGAAAEQTWPAEAQGSDKLHILLGWVPGTNLLLGGYYYAANSMWITGSTLYTLDGRSGAIKELKASLRLGGRFQWHPTQPGLLLFGNSLSSPVMGAPRPTVLDVVTGKLTALAADENVSSSALSWARNGQTILLAARTVVHTPTAPSPFATAAIFQLDWPGGTPRALTKLAAAEQDDWPQPLPDGKRFLYIHILADGKTAELRLGALDGGLDTLVATGLTVNPAAGLSGFQWETQIAYTP